MLMTNSEGSFEKKLLHEFYFTSDVRKPITSFNTKVLLWTIKHQGRRQYVP